MGAYRETVCGACSRSVVVRKLESAQMRVGRKMLGESNTVAEVAVQ